MKRGAGMLFVLCFYWPLVWASPPSAEEIEQARQRIARDFGNAVAPESLSQAARERILTRYAHLDPNHEVPKDLLANAVTYYDANLSKFTNSDYITVVDFKPRSEEYSGEFGTAVRIDGLSVSNSNLRLRDVVVHGWQPVKEANVIQQRTHGCMALDFAVKDGVIAKIKGGSLLYAGVSQL